MRAEASADFSEPDSEATTRNRFWLVSNGDTPPIFAEPIVGHN